MSFNASRGRDTEKLSTFQKFKFLRRVVRTKVFVSRCDFWAAVLRCVGPGTSSSWGDMVQSIERRASRRFTMALPLTVRSSGTEGSEQLGQTRDVSFRGLYFMVDAEFEPGSSIEFILTLPREITMAGDVHIRCFAEIIRVEGNDDRKGVAARIDRYEFLPTA
jgi:PilZ domain